MAHIKVGPSRAHLGPQIEECLDPVNMTAAGREHMDQLGVLGFRVKGF